MTNKTLERLLEFIGNDKTKEPLKSIISELEELLEKAEKYDEFLKTEVSTADTFHHKRQLEHIKMIQQQEQKIKDLLEQKKQLEKLNSTPKEGEKS